MSPDARSAHAATILPGSVLRTRKGPVIHVGIAWHDGAVFHNAPGGGERFVPLAEFTRGNRLQVECGTRAERSAVLAQLDAYLADSGIELRGSRYNVFFNNCEHAVSRIRQGRARSPQLRRWLGAAGGLFVSGTLFALRSPVVRRMLVRLIFRV